MKLLLPVLAGLTAASVLLLCLAAVRLWATQALEDPALDTEDTTVDRLALLPEGHQPPPGLSALSPDERFLTHESARGLRALEDFLSRAA